MVIRNIYGKLVWLMVVLLILASISLTTYTWGRYLLFLIAAVVGACYLRKCRDGIRLKVDRFQKMLLAFTLYVGVSALWATSSDDAISKMGSILSILVCYYPIYAFYRDCGGVETLLNAIKWGTTAVSVYTITFVGMDALLLSASADNLRMDNTFANVNTLGLCAAVTIFLQLWQLLFRKGKKWEAICCIPSLLVIGASQSRKAIVFVAIGAVALIIMRHGRVQKPFKTMGILLLCVAAMAGILYWASQSQLFGGLSERMDGMLNMLSGSGKADNSALIRDEMKDLGIACWKQRPILGFGIGNTHYLVNQYIGRDTYMHNNYVEMLCGGGLVGFLLYYAMHISCIWNLLRLRKENKPLFSLGIVWIVLILFMDYGMVSYYGKADYLYLMTIFLIIEKLKQQKRQRLTAEKEGTL